MRSMVPGVPREARWIPREPHRTVPSQVLERMVHTALPQGSPVSLQPLADGFRNTNFKLQLDSAPEPIVLRIYEHDASLCQKEIDLMRLVGGSIQVPEVIHAEPGGWEDIPPFALMRYVEGISFGELKRRGDQEAIGQAAYSAGRTLACIGRTTFAKPGWLAPGPNVTAGLQRRMQADLRSRTHTIFQTDICKAAARCRRTGGDWPGWSI